MTSRSTYGPRLNPKVLATVCAEFDIADPVVVRWTEPRHRHVGACYTGVHGIHTIRVQFTTRRMMHQFIIHELMHASQCERVGGFTAYIAEYGCQLEAVGLDPLDTINAVKHDAYLRIPFEVEAYAAQNRADEQFDLILANGLCYPKR